MCIFVVFIRYLRADGTTFHVKPELPFHSIFPSNPKLYKNTPGAIKRSRPTLYTLRSAKRPNSLSKLTRNKNEIDPTKNKRRQDKSLKKAHVKTFDCINIYRHRRRKAGNEKKMFISQFSF